MLDGTSALNAKLNEFEKLEITEQESNDCAKANPKFRTVSIDSVGDDYSRSPKQNIRPLKDEDELSSTLNIDQKISPLIIALTLLASISGFMFGYDTGYISAALVSFGTDIGNHYLTYGQKEIITAATSLGALLTGLFAGICADIVGRKPMMMFSNLMFIIGAILQTTTHKFWQMSAGRLLMGFGVGIGSLVSPLFISEISPSKYRGRLTVVNSLCITGGQLIAYAIGAGTSKIKGGWRILVALSIVPSACQLILFFFFHDTPRYYIMKNQNEKACNVLRRIYKNASSEEIAERVRKIDVLTDSTKDVSILVTSKKAIVKLMTTPATLRALIIACGLQAAQQFCGFNALMYFSSTIFKTVGFSDATAVSIVVAATNFVFTAVAFIAVDKIGRRNMLLIGLPIMTGALVACSVAFHFLGVKFDGEDSIVESKGSNACGIVIIISMVIYIAAYALGPGAVAWQQSELFPQDVRGVGTSLATATNFSGTLVISATFLTMLKNITPTGTFALFAGITLCSVLFVYFCYPDLRGLELEDVQQVLSEGFKIKRASNLGHNRSGDLEVARDIMKNKPSTEVITDS